MLSMSHPSPLWTLISGGVALEVIRVTLNGASTR